MHDIYWGMESLVAKADSVAYNIAVPYTSAIFLSHVTNDRTADTRSKCQMIPYILGTGGGRDGPQYTGRSAK